MDQRKMLTKEMLARSLGVSKTFVERRMTEGMPFIKVASDPNRMQGRVLFVWEDVVIWLQENYGVNYQQVDEDEG